MEDRLTPANKIWTGAVDSNFTTGANWIGGAPTTADVAVFDPTAGGTNAACTINAAIDVGGIQISGGYSGTITVPTVANTIILETNGFSQSSGIFQDIGGTSITLKGGNFSITSGTFTAGSGTVNFAAPAAAQTFRSGGQSFANVVHSGAGVLQLVSDPLTVTTSFSNSAGTFSLNGQNWTMTGATFTNPGTVQLRGSETVTGLVQDASQGTWSYVGDNTGSTVTLKDFGATDYYNLVISDGNTNPNIYQAGAALSLNNFLFIASGTYDANGQTTTVGGATQISGGTYLAKTAAQNLNSGLTIFGGTFTGSTGSVSTTNVSLSSGTLTAPMTLNVAANFNITGGTFTPGSGTVNFTLNTFTQTLNTGGQSFANITHSGTGILQLVTNPLTVTSSFTNSAGTFDLNGRSWTMTGATFGNPGTVRLRGTETVTGLVQDVSQGTWTYVGDNTGSTITLKDFGATDYFNLIINDPNATKDTFQAGAALDVTGAFTVTGGTYAANGNTTNVTGLTRVNGGTYQASTAAQNLNGGLTVSVGTFTGSSGTVSTTTLTQSGGTLTAPTTLNVSGNFTRTGGTFNAGAGTVFLTGGDQAVSGNTAFFNLSKTTTVPATLTFAAGSLQSVAGTLTLQGVAGGLLALRSAMPGTQWQLSPDGVRDIAFVDVQDSNNVSATAINPTASINSGNNVNWSFGPAITMSPASQTVLSGDTATLSVTADGVGLTYQWYSGSSGDTTNPIAGATAASFTTPPLTASAQYWVRVTDGAGNATDSATAIVNVAPVPTRITLTGSGSPSQAGQAVTFTAIVSADQANPTGGTVTFLIDGVAQGSAPLVGGVATFTTTSLAAGGHTVVAVYGGSTSGPVAFAGSTSALLTQTVQATSITAVGAGAGGDPHVVVYNADGSLRFSFLAFDPAFRGGVTVAVGDVTGDLVEDVIVGAGLGALNGHIKVFDGVTGAEVRSFSAFPGFVGGVTVGAGDIDADGRADIIVGAGAGALGGHVKVFSGLTGAEIRSFQAFSGFVGGVTVAGGDINHDGFADIVVGAGPGARGHVKVFDGATGALIRSFLAFPAFNGGVNVAAGDLNGDGFAEVIVGAEASASHVKVFDGSSQSLVQSFLAFPGFNGGVRVRATDLNGDGFADLLVGAGPGAEPRVLALNGQTLAELDSFFAFLPAFRGGIFVG